MLTFIYFDWFKRDILSFDVIYNHKRSFREVTKWLWFLCSSFKSRDLAFDFIFNAFAYLSMWLKNHISTTNYRLKQPIIKSNTFKEANSTHLMKNIWWKSMHFIDCICENTACTNSWPIFIHNLYILYVKSHQVINCNVNMIFNT